MSPVMIMYQAKSVSDTTTNITSPTTGSYGVGMFGMMLLAISGVAVVTLTKKRNGMI